MYLLQFETSKSPCRYVSIPYKTFIRFDKVGCFEGREVI